MMQRRRFLALSAAFVCAPTLGRADTWSGRALGADVSVTLHGPPELTQRALADVPRLLVNFEQSFSLFQPTSSLSKLNMMGRLRQPNALMRTLMARADQAYRLTGGVFDPTVQPVWDAMARGRDTARARAAIGWHRVRSSDDMIELQTGQSLTFNGIAQGFATDVMRLLLAQHGATEALINIGEQAAMGGPFTLGVVDPEHGQIGTRDLNDRAIATSSPGALRFGAHSHLLSPKGDAARWSTVSIEAQSATLADALSTAAVFMTRDELRGLKRRAKLHRITLVGAEGDVTTL
ncbi:FAD:protein FMN transferase [Marivita sp. S6314]|uniref:FAD:protein FMN transferase n=1 Tax=Marivita sp. S6314 TaxID=2926406 RepID=UPI001FF10BA7|nr:FAD:protein FMN transferase [Marivita sp. S6314]MCK0151169.1 FAD:protein FMN transferase [Marivita sp. S6314]